MMLVRFRRDLQHRVRRLRCYLSLPVLKRTSRWTCLLLRLTFRLAGLKTFGKYVHWSTMVHLASGFDVELRPGTTDVAVFYEVFGREAYSRFLRTIEAEVDLPEQPVVVDLGANIGLTALMFKLRYPAARLLCVEPESGNFNLLQRNAARYGTDAVMVNALITSSDGIGYLQDCGGEWGYAACHVPAAGSQPVRAMRLPQLLRESGVGTVDILKCDIEGSEVEVMSDVETWGDSVRAMIVELHPKHGYGLRQFAADLSRSGLEWKLIDPEAAVRRADSPSPFIVGAVNVGLARFSPVCRG